VESGGERVFVVRREEFFGGRWPQGFLPLGPIAGRELVREIEARAFLVQRALAESNPDWQQPIPYCLLTSGSAVFCVRRRSRGTEKRLHGLYSVGLGGHVGPSDRAVAAPDGLMQACLKRELREELVLPAGTSSQARLVGLVKDDSNAVGQVHVGLVYRLELASAVAAKAAVRETSKLHGAFTPLVELHKLWEDPPRFETWSQLVLKGLGLAPERPGRCVDPMH